MRYQRGDSVGDYLPHTQQPGKGFGRVVRVADILVQAATELPALEKAIDGITKPLH